jgi:hypothetical protein
VNGVAPSVGLVRGYSSGHFALRLDTAGVPDITLLAGREGGLVAADVISVFGTGLPFAKKHLGPPRYEPFVVPIGLAMSDDLFNWVAGSWGLAPEARNGAVVECNANLAITREAAFFGALVAETQVPALDASAKEAGHLTVRFQPEFIDVTSGTGTLSLALAKQKLWRTSNFRLQIDGLDCTKISRIDGITVTRKVTMVSSGSGGVSLVPDEVEFPNLKVTLSQASAQTWLDWHKSFVVDGNNGDAFERNGTISFLSNDLTSELSRIELHGLGIVRVGPAVSQNAGHIARVMAELYCEQMVLARE